ncbi:MAG: glycerate kinase, partial [Candidatus Aminicenantales bacterium]
KFVRRKGDTLEVAGRAYDLSRYSGIYIFGAGKASAAMARPLEEILGEAITDGTVVVKYGYSLPLKRIRVREAGHPLPDKAGLEATEKIVDMLKKTGEKDLIFMLISGGGSALLCLPPAGISLDEIQETTQILLGCGANIHELNAARKHLSLVKGGRLAKYAYPSTLISLLLSDVIGDKLESIASGPCVPDSSSFSDCLAILDKYRIRKKIPAAVLDFLEKGVRGEAEETLKKGHPAFEKTLNVIIGNNKMALEGAERKASRLGYNTHILPFEIQGEAREAAISHSVLASRILLSNQPVEKPACVISGGETTVTVKGKGKGGRSQEFVLAAAIGIEGLENVVILSAGTDGTDGPTDAAGALADGKTVERARKLGLDARHFLKENDSYHFFKRLGGLIITGPTLTNVMDLQLILVG